MTDTFRAMCAELVELSAPVDSVSRLAWRLQQLDRLANRARALLAQPQPAAEGPTDEEIADWHGQCVDLTRLREADHYWAFDLRSDEVAGVVRAALARWGRPTPQPEGSDIHYSWELHDAEGEWQAGGSANSLEDVQREGNRYLQTYSQGGPHKLIIERHCVTIIEEVTND